MNAIIGLLFAASAAGGSMPPARAPDFVVDVALPHASETGTTAENHNQTAVPGESAERTPGLARQLQLAMRNVAPAATSADTVQGTSGGALPPDWDDISWDGFDTCGNGTLDLPDEECDRTDFGGATCSLLGFAGGTLGCSHQCAIQTLQCSLPVASCSASSCNVDADCGAGCGPCVHVDGWPGYCQGATGGGGG